MDIRKIVQGKGFRPKAEEWNRLADLANATQKGNRKGQSSPQHDTVTVYNGTGSTVEAFTCWELIELTGKDARLFHSVFGLVVPHPDTEAVLAVTQETIRPGESGRALVSGVTPLRAKAGSVGDIWAAPDGRGGMVTSASDGAIRLISCPSKGEDVVCIASLGAGRGEGVRGPFHCRLETRDGRTRVTVRDTSIGEDATIAGLVQLGHRALWVNAVDLPPSQGNVCLIVKADDMTDSLSAELVLLPQIPPSFPPEVRAWWLLLAYVRRTGDGDASRWSLGLQRQPGNVEILGRWA